MIPTTINEITFSEIEPNTALDKVLDTSRVDVIGRIGESGLRGRGGAGFPTSVKWNLAAAARDDEKFVVCNADEGEPGTFKDRYIITEFADLVIEGMTIAAYSIQAQKGIFYLRGEYTYLKKHLESVIAERRAKGLLGDKIKDRDGFNFDIEIRMGAGAYICGEETALIESLEGQRGEPRNRPPFPVDTGFMKHPTVVNNVETFAWVCAIINKGPDWFKSSGTEKSTGLKLFSVSGDCQTPGVYEYPMGITVRQLLENVGGENAKAVQIGGASGQCIPRKDFDRMIAYEDIATGGSIIVFGPDRDMLKVAENFLEFFVEESCGQCTPCREGNPKLLEGVELLKHGQCSMSYLMELCSLGETMQLTSKCGLGQSSPNAFLSIVKHFKNEIMGRTELASV